MIDIPENNSEYINFFERNPIPMWIYAQKTLQFLRVNPAAVSQYGYSEAEFLELTIQDLLPPGTTLPDKPFAQLFAGDDLTGTWRHRRKDGVVIVVELVSLPFKYQGQPANIVMAHDITKYLMLDRTNSDLMADAAHEMRTPLTAIMGFADLLTTQKTLPPDTQQQFLSRIYASGQRLKDLLNDILERTQPEPLSNQAIQRERCRAGTMIKAALTTFSHAVPDAQFTLDEPPQEIFLYVDKTKITQVLFTLIGDAVKSSVSGGSVWVSWGLINGDFVVSISCQPGTISGPSMLLEGGVEMTLSEWIITAHDGRIWIDHTVQGHMVKFAIPTGFEPRKGGGAAVK